MKLLIVSDEESRKIWNYYEPGMLDGYDLILSAGDLSPQYLEFLVTMSHAPVLYVHGNHDEIYEFKPPCGAISVEDIVYNYKGLRILGLGGCMKYKPGKTYFTEREMRRRAFRVRPKILLSRGFDILLTHAPAKGVHDGGDLPHRGFETFNFLIRKYRPAYFIHGHVHKRYGDGYQSVDCIGGTTVINACGTYELEIPDDFLEGRKSPRKCRREGTVLRDRSEDINKF